MSVSPEHTSLWRAVGVFWLSIISYGFIALAERFAK